MEDYKPYKCNMCDNLGIRQFCYECKKHHGHGLVCLDKEYKNGSYAWWLCNKCSEREQ
jgi:hypothetical protein